MYTGMEKSHDREIEDDSSIEEIITSEFSILSFDEYATIRFQKKIATLEELERRIIYAKILLRQYHDFKSAWIDRSILNDMETLVDESTQVDSQTVNLKEQISNLKRTINHNTKQQPLIEKCMDPFFRKVLIMLNSYISMQDMVLSDLRNEASEDMMAYEDNSTALASIGGQKDNASWEADRIALVTIVGRSQDHYMRKLCEKKSGINSLESIIAAAVAPQGSAIMSEIDSIRADDRGVAEELAKLGKEAELRTPQWWAIYEKDMANVGERAETLERLCSSIDEVLCLGLKLCHIGEEDSSDRGSNQKGDGRNDYSYSRKEEISGGRDSSSALSSVALHGTPKAAPARRRNFISEGRDGRVSFLSVLRKPFNSPSFTEQDTSSHVNKPQYFHPMLKPAASLQQVVYVTMAVDFYQKTMKSRRRKPVDGSSGDARENYRLEERISSPRSAKTHSHLSSPLPSSSAVLRSPTHPAPSAAKAALPSTSIANTSSSIITTVSLCIGSGAAYSSGLITQQKLAADGDTTAGVPDTGALAEDKEQGYRRDDSSPGGPGDGGGDVLGTLEGEEVDETDGNSTVSEEEAVTEDAMTISSIANNNNNRQTQTISQLGGPSNFESVTFDVNEQLNVYSNIVEKASKLGFCPRQFLLESVAKVDYLKVETRVLNSEEFVAREIHQLCMLFLQTTLQESNMPAVLLKCNKREYMGQALQYQLSVLGILHTDQCVIDPHDPWTQCIDLSEGISPALAEGPSAVSTEAAVAGSFRRIAKTAATRFFSQFLACESHYMDMKFGRARSMRPLNNVLDTLQCLHTFVEKLISIPPPHPQSNADVYRNHSEKPAALIDLPKLAALLQASAKALSQDTVTAIKTKFIRSANVYDEIAGNMFDQYRTVVFGETCDRDFGGDSYTWADCRQLVAYQILMIAISDCWLSNADLLTRSDGSHNIDHGYIYCPYMAILVRVFDRDGDRGSDAEEVSELRGRSVTSSAAIRREEPMKTMGYADIDVKSIKSKIAAITSSFQGSRATSKLTAYSEDEGVTKLRNESHDGTSAKELSLVVAYFLPSPKPDSVLVVMNRLHPDIAPVFLAIDVLRRTVNMAISQPFSPPSSQPSQSSQLSSSNTGNRPPPLAPTFAAAHSLETRNVFLSDELRDEIINIMISSKTDVEASLTESAELLNWEATMDTLSGLQDKTAVAASSFLDSRSAPLYNYVTHALSVAPRPPKSSRKIRSFPSPRVPVNANTTLATATTVCTAISAAASKKGDAINQQQEYRQRQQLQQRGSLKTGDEKNPKKKKVNTVTIKDDPSITTEGKPTTTRATTASTAVSVAASIAADQKILRIIDSSLARSPAHMPLKNKSTSSDSSKLLGTYMSAAVAAAEASAPFSPLPCAETLLNTTGDPDKAWLMAMQIYLQRQVGLLYKLLYDEVPYKPHKSRSKDDLINGRDALGSSGEKKEVALEGVATVSLMKNFKSKRTGDEQNKKVDAKKDDLYIDDDDDEGSDRSNSDDTVSTASELEAAAANDQDTTTIVVRNDTKHQAGEEELLVDNSAVMPQALKNELMTHAHTLLSLCSDPVVDTKRLIDASAVDYKRYLDAVEKNNAIIKSAIDALVQPFRRKLSWLQKQLVIISTDRESALKKYFEAKGNDEKMDQYIDKLRHEISAFKRSLKNAQNDMNTAVHTDTPAVSTVVDGMTLLSEDAANEIRKEKQRDDAKKAKDSLHQLVNAERLAAIEVQISEKKDLIGYLETELETLKEAKAQATREERLKNVQRTQQQQDHSMQNEQHQAAQPTRSSALRPGVVVGMDGCKREQRNKISRAEDSETSRLRLSRSSLSSSSSKTSRSSEDNKDGSTIEDPFPRASSSASDNMTTVKAREAFDHNLKCVAEVFLDEVAQNDATIDLDGLLLSITESADGVVAVHQEHQQSPIIVPHLMEPAEGKSDVSEAGVGLVVADKEMEDGGSDSDSDSDDSSTNSRSRKLIYEAYGMTAAHSIEVRVRRRPSHDKNNVMARSLGFKESIVQPIVPAGDDVITASAISDNKDKDKEGKAKKSVRFLPSYVSDLLPSLYSYKDYELGFLSMLGDPEYNISEDEVDATITKVAMKAPKARTGGDVGCIAESTRKKRQDTIDFLLGVKQNMQLELLSDSEDGFGSFLSVEGYHSLRRQKIPKAGLGNILGGAHGSGSSGGGAKETDRVGACKTDSRRQVIETAMISPPLATATNATGNMAVSTPAVKVIHEIKGIDKHRKDNMAKKTRSVGENVDFFNMPEELGLFFDDDDDDDGGFESDGTATGYKNDLLKQVDAYLKQTERTAIKLSLRSDELNALELMHARQKRSPSVPKASYLKTTNNQNSNHHNSSSSNNNDEKSRASERRKTLDLNRPVFPYHLRSIVVLEEVTRDSEDGVHAIDSQQEQQNPSPQVTVQQRFNDSEDVSDADGRSPTHQRHYDEMLHSYLFQVGRDPLVQSRRRNSGQFRTKKAQIQVPSSTVTRAAARLDEVSTEKTNESMSIAEENGAELANDIDERNAVAVTASVAACADIGTGLDMTTSHTTPTPLPEAKPLKTRGGRVQSRCKSSSKTQELSPRRFESNPLPSPDASMSALKSPRGAVARPTPPPAPPRNADRSRRSKPGREQRDVTGTATASAATNGGTGAVNKTTRVNLSASIQRVISNRAGLVSKNVSIRRGVENINNNKYFMTPLEILYLPSRPPVDLPPVNNPDAADSESSALRPFHEDTDMNFNDHHSTKLLPVENEIHGQFSPWLPQPYPRDSRAALSTSRMTHSSLRAEI